MKKNFLVLLLSLTLLLSGCGWMDGSYVHVSDHLEKGPEMQDTTLTASSYLELQNLLSQLVRNGTSEGLIYLSDYAQSTAESGMYVASRWLTTKDPVGAYAVDEVEYEIGSNSGKPAVSVIFHFRRSPTEIQQIRQVRNTAQARDAIGFALENLKPGIVMLVEEYESADFIQMVTDYARSHPQSIMEIPQVTESIYGTEKSRVVELNFSYHSSRDALKLMKSQVEPVFEAAKMYISEDVPMLQQYAQLYSFLMERFEYRIQPSITPSYSLLHHGVGDSDAFAMVYQAMCQSVGLECRTITGTRNGSPWTWNLIDLDGHYGHVDLLRSNELGQFHVLTSEEVQDYVWDYSASPDSSEPKEEDTAAETSVPEEPAADPGESKINP